MRETDLVSRNDDRFLVWLVYLLPLLVTPLISPGQLFLEELQDEESMAAPIEEFL